MKDESEADVLSFSSVMLPDRSGRRSNRAVNAKVLPRPGSLCTVICPPMRATSREAIVRPSPVPPYFRVVEVSSCSNARNIRSC